MSLIKIIARFRCDGCNNTFELDNFDVADTLCSLRCLDKTISLHSVAMEQLRNNDGQIIGPSEQGNHDLCADCTKYIDEHVPDDDPTYDQVSAALNKRAGV